MLDAAERVMAEHGFEAATLARVVEEAGIPMSSVHHHFGSKDGILLAIMERGADCFFADLPDLHARAPAPAARALTGSMPPDTAGQGGLTIAGFAMPGFGANHRAGTCTSRIRRGRTI